MLGVTFRNIHLMENEMGWVTPKAKTQLCVCKYCTNDFKAADVKASICSNCKLLANKCKCGCGGATKGLHRLYILGHSASDMNNKLIRRGHRQQSKKMLGSNNPSKRLVVRNKISLALRGRCVWQEGKTRDEIEDTLMKIVKGRNKTYTPKYEDDQGNTFRSKLEVQVANLLTVFCIKYQYERILRLRGKYTKKHVVPDFTLVSDNDNPRCLIEVTGSYYDNWKKATIRKIKKIRLSYPVLPIVLVVDSKSVEGLRELAQLEYVQVFSIGKPVENLAKIRTLLVDSDHFNFDYSHFLPWHDGACAEFHGHSSKVAVAVTGLVDHKGMVLDFSDIKKIVKLVLKEVDHKVFVPDYAIKRVAHGIAYIKFISKGRAHKLELPISEVVKLSCDSTIENIAGILGKNMLDRFPWNVESVTIRVNEGIAKSAVATVERTVEDSHSLAVSPNKFLQVLHFYQRTPMWKEKWGSCVEQTFIGKSGMRLIKNDNHKISMREENEARVHDKV